MRLNALPVAVLLFSTVPGTSQSDRPSDAAEASGVAKHGNQILIVSDSEPGVYYRLPLPSTLLTTTVDPARLQRVVLAKGDLALDLEEVDVLVDGRVVALSERLRTLVTADGRVIEYDDPFSEVAECGLEGLAITKSQSGGSRVAVLWEGGYLRKSELSTELISVLGDSAVRPVIIVQDIPANALAKRQRARDTDPKDIITLDVPKPPGVEPAAQRFRAPDLEWHKIGNQEWGFIVLLNSMSANPLRFDHLWLQRFDSKGQRIGTQLDLDAIAPTDLKGRNWEGLAWLEVGKTLVLIDDTSQQRPKGPPALLVVTLPTDWQWRDDPAARD